MRTAFWVPTERNEFERTTLIGMEIFENRTKPPVTKAERDAKLEKRRVEGEENLAALEKENEAFMSNFERLKAERKARELAAKG